MAQSFKSFLKELFVKHSVGTNIASFRGLDLDQVY